MSRLKEIYKSEIVEAMTKKFGYKNVMEVPKLDKVTKSPITSVSPNTRSTAIWTPGKKMTTPDP